MTKIKSSNRWEDVIRHVGIRIADQRDITSTSCRRSSTTIDSTSIFNWAWWSPGRLWSLQLVKKTSKRICWFPKQRVVWFHLSCRKGSHLKLHRRLTNQIYRNWCGSFPVSLWLNSNQSGVVPNVNLSQRTVDIFSQIKTVVSLIRFVAIWRLKFWGF